MAAGPRVGWARGPCHRVVRRGGRQQLADVADARQGRQRLIFKQCCSEQLEFLSAAQAEGSPLGFPLSVEQVQLGNAVDVLAINQILPTGVVDVDKNNIESIARLLLQSQHRRCHLSADLAPIGVELDQRWASVG